MNTDKNAASHDHDHAKWRWNVDINIDELLENFHDTFHRLRQDEELFTMCDIDSATTHRKQDK
jgi:hypothetical protein